MVIPPTKTAPPSPVHPPTTRARRPDRRPRVPVPIPVEPEAPPAVAASILPPALHALLMALPPEARLPLEVLAPLVVQRTPLANATLTLWAYLLKPATSRGSSSAIAAAASSRSSASPPSSS